MAEIIKVVPDYGKIKGNKNGAYEEYLGITYAHAERFGYAVAVENKDGVFDCTKAGDSCPQTRTYINQLGHPERRFYYREFREGENYVYSENCLNLSVWTREDLKNAPVLVFVHGGGFNSGSNAEKYIDGKHYAERGVVFVAINYRVGILGFAVGEDLKKGNREGNFGLFDQLEAFRFIKKHIAAFGGNPENITLMGQSAGAISLQYHALSKLSDGLFCKMIFLSGGGLFPKFALPKKSVDCREYWTAFAEFCGKEKMSDLSAFNLKELFERFEDFKKTRKDNGFSNMPTIDGELLTDDVRTLFDGGNLKKVPCVVSTTKHDIFPIFLYNMASELAKTQEMPCYLAFFDRNMKGDDNKSFHSSDLWYAIGNTERCWRPLDEQDEKIRLAVLSYFAEFCKSGNPNVDGLPSWLPYKECKKKRMTFDDNEIAMKKQSKIELFFITAKHEEYTT